MPTTTLDERFSGPGSSATAWSAAKSALEEAGLCWLTTVRADGRPHMTPLVAVWVDDAMYFTTGKEEQKAVNLRSNRHVLLSTGCNTWNSGLDVVVEGTADPVTDRPMLERLAQAWLGKWEGDWQYQVADDGFAGGVLVFEVRPAKVLAFGKGTFTQTRHRFAAH